ncbi:hypothetical protein ABPG75_008461 [Micractinium tetrahymenae]
MSGSAAAASGQPSSETRGLFSALLLGDTQGALRLLKTAGPRLQHVGPLGFTSLHAAVMGRCLEALPALAAAGAPLEGAPTADVPLSDPPPELRQLLSRRALEALPGRFRAAAIVEAGMTPLAAAHMVVQDSGVSNQLLDLGANIHSMAGPESWEHGTVSHATLADALQRPEAALAASPPEEAGGQLHELVAAWRDVLALRDLPSSQAVELSARCMASHSALMDLNRFRFEAMAACAGHCQVLQAAPAERAFLFDLLGSAQLLIQLGSGCLRADGYRRALGLLAYGQSSGVFQRQQPDSVAALEQCKQLHCPMWAAEAACHLARAKIKYCTVARLAPAAQHAAEADAEWLLGEARALEKRYKRWAPPQAVLGLRGVREADEAALADLRAGQMQQAQGNQRRHGASSTSSTAGAGSSGAAAKVAADALRCACCGCQVMHVRKCAACRQAGYLLLPPCQVEHWKRGGHREACSGAATRRAEE